MWCANLMGRDTVELCRRAEHAHVSWITVHGRTVKQRAEPVNNKAIKMVGCGCCKAIIVVYPTHR